MKRTAPRGDAVLVGVRHHRRVEERRGLQRVLAREVGAGEQAALLAELHGSLIQ